METHLPLQIKAYARFLESVNASEKYELVLVGRYHIIYMYNSNSCIIYMYNSNACIIYMYNSNACIIYVNNSEILG